MKKYQIIYADPPWRFKYYSKKGEREKSAQSHYDCLSVEDICKLPIKEISDKNCILFIWITFPMLENVFRVINNWGFQYKGLGFCWIKRNKKTYSWFYGCGYWTRQNPEICLIATKGSPKRIVKNVHCVVDSIIGEHSEKPIEVRKRIIELLGDLPRIELFARQKTEGWDVWGNEVKSDIELTPQEGI